MKQTMSVLSAQAAIAGCLLMVLGCAGGRVGDAIRQPEDVAIRPADDARLPTTVNQDPSVKHVGHSSPIQEPVAERTSGPLRSRSKKKMSRRSLDELLLFHPSKYPEGDWEPKGLVFADVWFTAEDKTRLHGWYCPHEQPRAVVLYAHGNAGNLSHRRPVVERLQKQLHVSVLIFDYRGYGRSDGKPTVEGVLSDARAARSAVAGRAKIEEADVVLMGRSLGGAILVQLASELAPRALIVESSFSSLRDVAATHYPLLAWIAPRAKLDSVSKVKAYTGPLLQSHGDADRIIPFSLGRKLFEAANEPKQFVRIPAGTHNDAPPTEYYRELDEFLERLPKAGGNRTLSGSR